MMTDNQVYYQQWGGDEQYTPKHWVELLLPYIQHLNDKTIRCPFDREDSQFVKVLQENWFKVVYSHLDYWQDFLTYEPEQRDVIISNPPYKNKRVFRERALNLGKPFALLLPINILSDSVINVTMRERERERVPTLNTTKKTKILQCKNGRDMKPTNIQSIIFLSKYIWKTNNFNSLTTHIWQTNQKTTT